MSSYRGRNPLDRRADLLGAEMKRRENSIFTRMVDPAPAFQQKKSEIDALRDYLRVKAQPDGLIKMRAEYGGPYNDDDVDAYVAWGENALAKFMPYLMGQSASGPNPDTMPEWTGDESSSDGTEAPDGAAME